MLAFGAALLGLASPLGAQDRGPVVQAYGGVYGHAINLADAPAAHFKAGYSFGGAVGYQLNRHFVVNGDFMFGRTDGLGAVPFESVNRFFYGADIEARYPVGHGFTPFVFAGGGAVTLDETGVNMPRFTKPAGLFGAGFAYQLGQMPAEFVAQARSYVYEWDRNGFERTQWDVTFVGGFRYHFGK
jgi:hypothetical protein